MNKLNKIFATFICIVYLLSTNACFAVNNLYFIKNTDKGVVKTIVENAISKNKYTSSKKDPYYAISSKKNSDYSVIILQQSSANMFYYFQSNGKNKKIDNAVKKALKAQNIVFEQSYNTNYLATFEKQANKVLTNTTTNYSFEQPKTQVATTTTPSQTTKSSTTLKGQVAQVATGSKINAYLQTPLNTATANVGDNVTAVLSQSWTYNGNTIAEQGSIVSGSVKTARHASYGSRNGRVVINFTQVTTPTGKVYNLKTEDIDFSITNDGKLQSSTKKIVTGAAIGLLCGLLAASLSSDHNWGSSMAIGAGSGAAAGSISAVVEAGIDAEIPVYTEMELILTSPLSVTLY